MIDCLALQADKLVVQVPGFQQLVVLFDHEDILHIDVVSYANTNLLKQRS